MKKQIQRGFKALNKDMSTKYGDMTYKLGKVYHEDKIEFCIRGFHYCNELLETLNFYSYKNSRFFEVEASGEIITSEEKNVCSDIKLIKEICKKDIEQYVYDNINELLNKYSDNYEIKCEIIENFNIPICILEELSNDDDWEIREAVAGNPNTPIYILKKLSNDKVWEVRETVTENPNTSVNILKKLSNDDDYGIRWNAQLNLQKRNK